MKLFLTKILFSLALIVSFSGAPLHAVSYGKTGKAYTKRHTQWQGVFMKGDVFHMKAAIPGSPVSRLSHGTYIMESSNKNGYYRVVTSAKDKEKVPKSYKAYVKKHKKNRGTFKKVQTTKKNVKYALNFRYTSPNGSKGLTRVYVTEKKIYILGAEGGKKADIKRFFNSFSIKKE